MADTKLVDLDPGNAEGTDIVYAVKDPSGVSLDRKIALSNIKDYILGGSPPTFTDAITVRSTDTGANAAPDVILYRDSASPADNDVLGQIKFDGEDSAGNQQTYGTITGQILDEASTSEDGALLFGVVTAGTLANEVRLDGAALSPVTSDGNALGTASLQWANLYVGSIELGHASDTTLTRSSGGNVAVEGNVVYRAGGTDVALADGGTGASLTDPNADRIMFWDDSAGSVAWLTAGDGLSISGTTMSALGPMTVQTFSSSGTWTKPSGCRAVIVEVIGGGGGSGGTENTTAGLIAASGGGGGGGYASKLVTTAGATESVTIGAGGSGGASGQNSGATGGTTSFGSHVSATGGGGGLYGVNTTSSGNWAATGGAGGTGSSGDVNLGGRPGYTALYATSPDPFGSGGDGGTAARGGTGALGSVNGNGTAGIAPGGGSGGALSYGGNGAKTGGAGAAGICVVWEFY